MMDQRCNRCLDAEGLIRMWGAVRFCRQCALDHGGTVGRRAVALHDIGPEPEAFTPAVLAKLAAGAIMDTNAIFLPAGRLSVAETEARERAGTERLA